MSGKELLEADTLGGGGHRSEEILVTEAMLRAARQIIGDGSSLPGLDVDKELTRVYRAMHATYLLQDRVASPKSYESASRGVQLVPEDVHSFRVFVR